jgi:prolyl oligopeptidase
MRTTAGLLLLFSILSCANPDTKVATAPTPAIPPPPVARTVSVTETTFGMQVSDPYRWMEGNDNAELTSWLRAQGAYTSAWLARIPSRDALLHRVRELGLASSSSFGVQLAGGRMFYRHVAPGEQLPKLMVRDANTPERVLVDPAGLGTGGSHASINAFAPSPDGALLAYDVALGGGEVSSIHIMDVASGKDFPDTVDRIWGEFPAAWLPDRSGFLYTQMAVPAKDVGKCIAIARPRVFHVVRQLHDHSRAEAIDPMGVVPGRGPGARSGLCVSRS